MEHPSISADRRTVRVMILATIAAALLCSGVSLGLVALRDHGVDVSVSLWDLDLGVRDNLAGWGRFNWGVERGLTFHDDPDKPGRFVPTHRDYEVGPLTVTRWYTVK